MTSKNIFENKLKILHKESIILREEFGVFKMLNKRSKDNYYAFFRIISDSLGLHSIAGLSKLLIDKNDLNIYHFIKFIESKINIFPIINHKEIRKKNSNFKQEIEKLKIIQPLEKYRDKGGAHIDRSLANQGKQIELTINLQHTEKAINEIVSLVSFYNNFKKTQQHFIDIGEAKDDLRNLDLLIKKHHL